MRTQIHQQVEPLRGQGGHCFCLYSSEVVEVFFGLITYHLYHYSVFLQTFGKQGYTFVIHSLLIYQHHRTHFAVVRKNHLTLRLTFLVVVKYPMIQFIHTNSLFPFHFSLFNSLRNSSSLINFTPRLCAFSNLLGPMFSPASIKSVFLLTDPLFLPP